MKLVKSINNFIYKTGLYKIISTDKKVVLLYHRINEDDIIKDYYLKGIFVSKINFDKQMKYLSKSDKKDDVIITFDDGYGDNYKYAFPILKKYNLKAIFFTTINFIEKKQNMWIDILNNYSISKNLSMENFKELSGKIKSLSIKKRNEFLEDLITKKYLTNDTSIDWKQLKEMKENGQIIANHTLNHPNFSQENKETVHEELKLAKDKLGEQLNIKDLYFAYPDGDIGNKEETLSILEKLGYKYAFTTKRGAWDEKTDNSLLINRIPIYYWDDFATFVNKVHGINIEDNLSFKGIVIKILEWIGIKEWLKKKLKS